MSAEYGLARNTRLRGRRTQKTDSNTNLSYFKAQTIAARLKDAHCSSQKISASIRTDDIQGLSNHIISIIMGTQYGGTYTKKTGVVIHVRPDEIRKSMVHDKGVS